MTNLIFHPFLQILNMIYSKDGKCPHCGSEKVSDTRDRASGHAATISTVRGTYPEPYIPIIKCHDCEERFTIDP